VGVEVQLPLIFVSLLALVLIVPDPLSWIFAWCICRRRLLLISVAVS
jgi:hypothetical protein